MKNQLFKNKPSLEFLNKFVTIYGLKNLDDNRKFSRENLANLKTVDNISRFDDDLDYLYIPCKKEKYLSNLNEKKAITILRQLVKCQDYSVNSQEKYLNGNKILLYHVEKEVPDNSYINYNLKILEF